jgi:hypothetical protein
VAALPRGNGGFNRSGCASPGAATPSSSAPPSINRTKETECLGMCRFAKRMFANHMGTASLFMLYALWPRPMFGLHWA